ncbi:peptidoglycan-associated lipoprotein Pal [Azohydromonas caseinilytica]|uniref:Peptidoglycan-associated lipoprotein n=1 Tax=Azohydromonas caseinilytica TaxID=2728836 RepID=A0A848F9M3_9BURK|nr:peptidoglycan-associated lipoprotein Pal [Azohydromonas caseinilytica]NML14711.1 peptidoglycan-associated lipoprotein Pal [Azohydromonas caseinilytica]
MNAMRGSLGALAVAALLAGCASGVKLNETPVESRTPTAADANAGGAGAAPQSQVTTVSVDPNGGAQNGLGRTVYFDFDSFVVKDEYRPVVEGQARRLNGDKSRRVSIEGHTDERGGREYNLALGQKRAEAVARSMTLLGVNANQIEPVSFGEERPAVQGSDEAAWAKNRRAEIKDR